MSFRCIKAFMHAFSGRFSRTCLEGISFNFFVCFIFNVSLGSAPKRKNFDIQHNTRVGSGGQFTSNRLSCRHMLLMSIRNTNIKHHCQHLKQPRGVPWHSQLRPNHHSLDITLIQLKLPILDFLQHTLKKIFRNYSFITFTTAAKIEFKLRNYCFLLNKHLHEMSTSKRCAETVS